MPRRKRLSRREDTPVAVTLVSRAESTLDGFADDLSRLLAGARMKAEAWLGERRSIAEQLTEIRDAADRWISALTASNEAAGRSRRRLASSTGGPSPSSKKRVPADRPTRTMSAEARAKIAAAQRARWAKQKAGK
jgi:hypothetical protein